MGLLRAIFAIAVALLAGCAQTNRATSARVERYEVVAKYAVGGAGGWDYPSVDEKRGRLYVSRGDRVQVVDTRTGQIVGEVAGTAGVHGIAFAEDLRLGRTANVTAIDAATRKVVGTVPVSGKPEFAVADGRGRVFVNIEDKNAMAVIDAATLGTPRYWPLGNCDEPTGLAIDARRGRLFSVCHNKKMIVMDAHDGRIVGELPIGSSVDGAAFDAGLDLAFSSNGDGTMTVVRCGEGDQCAVVGTVDTQRGARTIALDSSTHRIYLPTASFTTPAATAEQPKPRPTVVPDSFVILVLAPKPSS